MGEATAEIRELLHQAQADSDERFAKSKEVIAKIAATQTQEIHPLTMPPPTPKPEPQHITPAGFMGMFFRGLFGIGDAK